MRLSPHVLAMTLCAIASVVSAGEESYHSNLRAVYHGHGATSYQNVHIENGKSVPLHREHAIIHADAEHLSDNSHADRVAFVIPIPSENTHEVHLSNKVAYQELVLDQGESSIRGIPEYYNTYDREYEGEHEYEYYR